MRSLAFFNRKEKGLNIDITHRCALECPRCPRQFAFRDKGNKVYGQDVTLDDIKKLSKHYKNFDFCGQLSDPVHHPKFIEILEYLKSVNCGAHVHNASSQKPMSWYIKAFKANINARWIFGIDGLPNESHNYRVNQDGEKLFNVMLESKKYLIHKPVWQYIIFRYNQDHIEEAKQMAIDNQLGFIILQSSRWLDDNDPLTPTNEYKLSYKNG
jgi:MoaA/NifB/PqqE/SkfB family radical SAM enzyme|tara:strand:- start:2251 stop:2886 length:636 start_codon:yes stop_codon:yes gene_type:complete